MRVGADFEYNLGAGRATKYFSVEGVRIAGLATLYTAPSASLPPALYPVVRTLEPLSLLALASTRRSAYAALRS